MGLDFDWKNLIRTVAPTIGAVLSGGNPLVGMGIKAVSNVLLGKPDASEEEISYAIQNASPDMLLALKNADNDFKKEMAKIGLDEEKLRMADIDSARNREVALNDKTPAILAYLLTAMFGGILLTLVFGPEISVGNKAIVFSLSGSLGTVWIAAMAYYHGTSKSSADKNVLLRRVK